MHVVRHDHKQYPIYLIMAGFLCIYNSIGSYNVRTIFFFFFCPLVKKLTSIYYIRCLIIFPY
jgi:hypothetical protein